MTPKEPSVSLTFVAMSFMVTLVATLLPTFTFTMLAVGGTATLAVVGHRNRWSAGLVGWASSTTGMVLALAFFEWGSYSTISFWVVVASLVHFATFLFWWSIMKVPPTASKER